MPIETDYSNISKLNPQWPLGADHVENGDDHLRGIKKAVTQTFPNVDGVVNYSDDELNLAQVNIVNTSTLVTIKQPVDMQGKQITSLAAPTADSHATNSRYVSDNYVKKDVTSGAVTVAGDLTVTGATKLKATAIGDSTTPADLTLTGKAIVSSDLSVGGNSVLAGVTATTLATSGAFTTTGTNFKVTAAGDINANSIKTIGNVHGSNLVADGTINGAAKLTITNGGIEVTGPTTFHQTVTSTGLNTGAGGVSTTTLNAVGTSSLNTIEVGNQVLFKNWNFEGGNTSGNGGNLAFKISGPSKAGTGDYSVDDFYLANNQYWARRLYIVNGEGTGSPSTTVFSHRSDGGMSMDKASQNTTWLIGADANITGNVWGLSTGSRDAKAYVDWAAANMGPPSDKKLKHDIVDAKVGAGERIDALVPREFKWNDDQKALRGDSARGFIAQEAGEVDPLYIRDASEFLVVNDRAIIADLVATVQELRKEVAKFKGAK